MSARASQNPPDDRARLDRSGAQRSASRPTSKGTRIAALALGLVLLPFAIEVLYRALRLSGLSPTTNPAYVQHDAELGWRYRPGVRERHTSAVFDVGVAINAQGFRGPDWDLGATGGRILVLGDSFAFGWGVEHDATFAARLDDAGPDWTVYGAAVSGYGTDQQLLLLEELLPLVKPDLVISVFCWNDLGENTSQVVYGKHKPYFVQAAGGVELRGVPVAQTLLERTSYAYRAFHKWRWQRAQARRELDREAQWRLTLELLRETKRLLGDVPLLIVSDRRRLADFARFEEGIEHLDLNEVLAGLGSQVLFPVDGHWTPLAHERIALALGAVVDRLLAID